MDLASYAINGDSSKGRKYPEVFHDKRSPFERDRDRVINSKAFRRLEAKTQVFVAGTGDHYRTRLTHSLEVAQVSRGLARELKLNEDLTETIALAHDLGHPPFGHGGEDALDEMMQRFGMHFEHNEQSRRIVEVLEKAYPDFEGLNLTFETLDGMLKHQTAFDQQGKKFEKAAHMEAQIVNIGDEIAYTNHDMDDGLRAGMISLEELGEFELWQWGMKRVEELYGEIMDEDVLRSRVISSIVGMLMADLVENTKANVKKYEIETVDDVANFQGSIACFSDKMRKLLDEIRRFLYHNFYLNAEVIEKVEEGKGMIKDLFELYLQHPEKLPPHKKFENEQQFVVAIKDYIAGMTDIFLVEELQRLKG